jgi:hypothetical protein
MDVNDDAFESLITLCVLIFVIIFFSCFLSKLTKGTFCCKERIQNMDETLLV